MKTSMEKTVRNLSASIVGIRGKTISCGMVDTVKVPYHGQMTPISYVAYTGNNGKSIFVDPYEPDLVNLVAKSLSNAGFSAYAFSKTRVLVSVPPPSGEQKQENITHLKKLGENAKIAIRNIRKKIRQGLTKDELKQSGKKIQEIINSNIDEIDSIIRSKMKAL